jgi:hypothetical protein
MPPSHPEKSPSIPAQHGRQAARRKILTERNTLWQRNDHHSSSAKKSSNVMRAPSKNARRGEVARRESRQRASSALHPIRSWKIPGIIRTRNNKDSLGFNMSGRGAWAFFSGAGAASAEEAIIPERSTSTGRRIPASDQAASGSRTDGEVPPSGGSPNEAAISQIKGPRRCPAGGSSALANQSGSTLQLRKQTAHPKTLAPGF